MSEVIITQDCPAVPFDIFSLSVDLPDIFFGTNCEELWSEVLEEMLNPDFFSRSHHNTGTYDAGCRGPLCRKALREHPRRKSRQSNYSLREDRIYDPVLDYFHVVVKHRIKFAQSINTEE